MTEAASAATGRRRAMRPTLCLLVIAPSPAAGPSRSSDARTLNDPCSPFPARTLLPSPAPRHKGEESWVVATRCSDYSPAMFWGELLGPRAARRRTGLVAMGVALAAAQGLVAPSWGQAPPNVVIEEFTGSNLPGVNLVWAAVLIGIAVIILVAQQITHRLALRREADARGDL